MFFFLRITYCITPKVTQCLKIWDIKIILTQSSYGSKPVNIRADSKIQFNVPKAEGELFLWTLCCDMFRYVYRHKSCLNIIIVAFEYIDAINMIHYSTFPSKWMICLNSLTRKLLLNIFPKNVMPWNLNNWYLPYFFHKKAMSIYFFLHFVL